VPGLLDTVVGPGIALLAARPGDLSLGSALAAEGLASFGATGPPPAAALPAPIRSTDVPVSLEPPAAPAPLPPAASPAAPALPPVTTVAIERATLETMIAAIRQLQELALLNTVIVAAGGLRHDT